MPGSDFLGARLITQTARVSSGWDAEVTLQLFATALAVDTAETLIGVPSMQAPVLAVPFREIFKWERSRGPAEVQLYTYDREGRLTSGRRGARRAALAPLATGRDWSRY